MTDSIDPGWRSRFLVTEVAEGSRMIAAAFARIFDDEPPDVPHHILGFYIGDDGHLVPVSYVHFRPFGDVCLVGGAMTDPAAFANMPAAAAAALETAGGMYLQLLRYGFARFDSRFDGFFGYCNHERAWQVGLDAGFTPAETPNLRLRWPRPLHPNFQRALTAKVVALGPF